MLGIVDWGVPVSVRPNMKTDNFTGCHFMRTEGSSVETLRLCVVKFMWLQVGVLQRTPPIMCSAGSPPTLK